MIGAADFLTSFMSTGLRGLSGISAEPVALRPQQLLRLYDIETCPYCRLVREALTELDLDAEIYPCPKRGGRFRAEVQELGGKAQFPYLVDPNTGVALYESLDIIEYLYKTYAQRDLPLKWRFGGWQKASSMLASAPRISHGMLASGRQPRGEQGDLQLLELYSFEASPFARPVRERLCELEIPYILRSCGRNRLMEWVPPAIRDALELEADSELHNRVELQRREGRVGIPYLYDPNTEQSLFESDLILSYLERHYAS